MPGAARFGSPLPLPHNARLSSLPKPIMPQHNPSSPDRLQSLKLWLEQQGLHVGELRPASEDASFRRYFRVPDRDGVMRVVMDAPPEREPLDDFIEIDRRLCDAGLSAPQILAIDRRQGFLLMEDFGDEHYLDVLDEQTAPALYGDALEAIRIMQDRVPAKDLPPYDETLLRNEMALFREWFIEGLLGLRLDARQQEYWNQTTDLLVQSALEQPRAFVHRDYHSRNLMRIPPRPGRPNPGILDFQDAVLGPVTYDPVSLLRDCYIAWPRARVEAWLLDHLERARGEVLSGIEPRQFLSWFDLMGAQRQLKAIGIFARLKLRDGKPGYLGDIPRTLGYLQELTARDERLGGLQRLIGELQLADRIRRLLDDVQ